MHHVFGIRHHGPGSTHRLLKALESLQPDCILIEGPPDGDKLIRHIADPEMQPPVALLIYNPKDLSEGAYYPFADFSPEWQAMQFGLKRSIPTRFMDLPQALQFTLNRTDTNDAQLALELEKALEADDATEQQKAENKRILADPLGYLAKLAGYEDSERWWEVTFEHWTHEEIFPVLYEMMAALREEVNATESVREQQREAYMRQQIRLAYKEGFERIAVVCGAWHSPALQDMDKYKVSKDKALLRGIRKTKTEATWIPWTYDRLSFQSGYRAGVISPAYYQLLFSHPEQVVIRWMTEVARLLRKEDLDASSAHVIEAVRLAQTISSLRKLQVPGIGELREAAISIFCSGYPEQLELVEQKLIIGDRMGQVPPSIPVIPLQKDLEKSIKSARLTKERNSSDKKEKELDLRTPSNLLASQLLHRLNILGIDWGWEREVRKYGLAGSFHEHWLLKWRPEFALKIIEAGMWGKTVYEASQAFIRKQIESLDKLPALSKLVDQTLKADLKEVIELLVSALQAQSAKTQDIQLLMDALPPLVNALRYGSTRQLDVGSMEQVVKQMIPRIVIGLPNASMHVDDEVAADLFDKLLSVHRSIQLLDQHEYVDAWHQMMLKMALMGKINGRLRGGCSRLLFDKRVISLETTAKHMSFSLSRANDTTDAALWVEGFLHGSGLLLIHNPGLWRIMDEWVDGLSWEVFQEILPLLRRTFSDFSAPERQKMLGLAKIKTPDAVPTETESNPQGGMDEKRARKVLPNVKLLLGLEKQ
ncbi:MAG: DUF5682 family protein [Bacteroidota bacterium]